MWVKVSQSFVTIESTMKPVNQEYPTKQTCRISCCVFCIQPLPVWGCTEECSRTKVQSGYPHLCLGSTMHPLLAKTFTMRITVWIKTVCSNKEVNINGYHTVYLRGKKNNEILPAVIVSNTNPEKKTSWGKIKENGKAINLLLCKAVREWHQPQTLSNPTATVHEHNDTK